MDVISAIETPLTVFEAAYAQRALLAVLLVALLAGAVGSAIVLRDLPFFTHAVGAGAYPFLVLALSAGVALQFGAIVGSVVFALVLTFVTRRTHDSGRRDAVTGLLVAGALAVGAVITATAVPTDTRFALTPEALLFGSLFAVDDDVLITALAVAAITVPLSLMLSNRWIATGFDPQVADRIGSGHADAFLLAAVALSAAATLPLTGSLLAGALLVIPAATVRLVVDRKGALAPLTFAIAFIEGVLGLYLSIVLDFPAGATIAVVAGIGFALGGCVAFTRIARRIPTAKRISAPMAAIALSAALLVSSCGGSESGGSEQAADADAISVVATTPQVADIVEQVGGDAVNVTTVLPPGSDPHEFEPKPSDLAAMADADVIFRSGGDLDAWAPDAAKSAGGPVPIDLSESVVLIEGGHSHGDEEHSDEEAHSDEKAHSDEEAHSDGEAHSDEEVHSDEGGFNSHWYLSPENVNAAALAVRDELVKATPAERETVRANADDYVATIAEASDALSACVAKVPKADRSFVSGHDDFAYLAEAFDLEVAAQLAESGQSESSAKQLQEALDEAREHNAQAVAMSTGEVSQLGKQVAQRLDVPLLELYADSLAASGLASSAVGAIEFNVSKLVDAMSDGSVECATKS